MRATTSAACPAAGRPQVGQGCGLPEGSGVPQTGHGSDQPGEPGVLMITILAAPAVVRKQPTPGAPRTGDAAGVIGHPVEDPPVQRLPWVQ
jgi:hypothetical protein